MSFHYQNMTEFNKTVYFYPLIFLHRQTDGRTSNESNPLYDAQTERQTDKLKPVEPLNSFIVRGYNDP